MDLSSSALEMGAMARRLAPGTVQMLGFDGLAVTCPRWYAASRPPRIHPDPGPWTW